MTDHPRSRGVYVDIAGDTYSVAGSSPLARGLLIGPVPLIGFERIIPARAGFTQALDGSAGGPGDHPRSRGVYAKVRTWNETLTRIIPARAGFTSTLFIFFASAAGSSPLARGLPDKIRRFGEGFGIIPARAGFTRPRIRGIRVQGDHPRSRGVYCPYTLHPIISVGSSPLARGVLGTKI